MDREALERLIKAVEDGSATGRFHELCRESGFSFHMVDIARANSGSLDAAKALHEALLPGWIWNIVDDSATIWRGPPDDPMDGVQEEYCVGKPARAWLLAILKAKLATLGDV